MARYFLELSYKGTGFSGFQVQQNANTIQAEVEKALLILHGKKFELTGSSRTDGGVHALQNYFHFDADEIHPQSVYKLNAILPFDIAVKKLYKMSGQAHCRFDALSREYEYQIHRFKNPFKKETSFYYPYQLNNQLLNEAATFVKQQTNFFGFAKSNTQVANFHCSIYNSQWQLSETEMIYRITGNRFLRGMVRLLTASILKVGREQLSFEDFKNLFEGKQKAGYSVPAEGLFLKSVNYPQNYFLLQA